MIVRPSRSDSAPVSESEDEGRMKSRGNPGEIRQNPGNERSDNRGSNDPIRTVGSRGCGFESAHPEPRIMARRGQRKSPIGRTGEERSLIGLTGYPTIASTGRRWTLGHGEGMTGTTSEHSRSYGLAARIAYYLLRNRPWT